MNMRIHEARREELAASIQPLCLARGDRLVADRRDAAVADQDIAWSARSWLFGRYDRDVLDQQLCGRRRLNDDEQSNQDANDHDGTSCARKRTECLMSARRACGEDWAFSFEPA